MLIKKVLFRVGIVESQKVPIIKMKVLLVVLTLFSLSWCDELPTIEKFFHKIGQYGEFLLNNL